MVCICIIKKGGGSYGEIGITPSRHTYIQPSYTTSTHSGRYYGEIIFPMTANLCLVRCQADPAGWALSIMS